MKLHGQTIILLPWWDAEGMKQWLRLTFNGTVDSRFMYRQIVAYIKKEFNKTVDKNWVKRNCPMLNEYRDSKGKDVRKQISDDTSFTQLLEEYIQRMESYEDEDEPDSVLPPENTGSSELPVSSMPNKD